MCLIISKVDGYIEEKNGNKFLVLQIQTKKYQKSTQNFGMNLKVRLKQQIINQVNLEKKIP